MELPDKASRLSSRPSLPAAVPGESRDVDREQRLKMFQRGTNMERLCSDGWLKGKVLEASTDGAFVVRYDDGSFDAISPRKATSLLEAEHLRALQAQSTLVASRG